MILLNKKTIGKVKDQLKRIQLEDIVPKAEPFIPIEQQQVDWTTIKRHQRAQSQLDYDLLQDKWIKKENPLPPDFKSILEVSCRAYECPLCLNFDVYTGGVCYGCIYCFAKLFEQSLYSAFYDGYDYRVVRPASKKHITETLEKLFHNKGSGEFQKAFNRKVPIRLGIRDEDFLPSSEKKYKRSLFAMKLINDHEYPMMINTKSNLVIKNPWFKQICEFGDRMSIQVSIIHCDREISHRIEQKAPAPDIRWDVIKTLNEVGIQAQPRIEPLMAFINGTDEHMEEYVRKTAEAGAHHITTDTYHYFANTEGIRDNFLRLGFDYPRMFEATSEYQIIGSILIEKLMMIAHENGIGCSSFNFRSLPMNSHDICCGVDNLCGINGYNKFNLLTAGRLLIRRKKMSLKDLFDFAEPLSKPIADEVMAVWNHIKPSCWAMDWIGGVKPVGQDEYGLIYGYDEKEYVQELETIADAIER